MREIKVGLPEEMLEALQSLVDRKAYASRNQAIRTAIRDLCRKERIPIGKKK